MSAVKMKPARLSGAKHNINIPKNTGKHGRRQQVTGTGTNTEKPCHLFFLPFCFALCRYFWGFVFIFGSFPSIFK